MPKQIFHISLLFFFCFYFALPLMGAEIEENIATNNVNLFLSDCDKCHQKEINDIAEAGLAHQTELTCTDCHKGHRPKSFENIPNCSLCHVGNPHYQLQQCLICHRNPHRPLDIKLPKKAHHECLTCHEPQGIELATYPSYHSDLVCTDCHQRHGQLPPCMSCHKGHNQQMTEGVCQNCHQPHKPLEISYADSTPTSDCSGCHSDAAGQLASSTKKHRLLSCADCHRQKHKMIPQCTTCHGAPHADAMLEKFPDCGSCHGTAHDLH